MLPRGPLALAGNTTSTPAGSAWLPQGAGSTPRDSAGPGGAGDWQRLRRLRHTGSEAGGAAGALAAGQGPNLAGKDGV